MQQIVKFKEGSKAPITYLSDVIQTMKQHHLYNIILYDIVYYLKHEQTRQKYTQIYWECIQACVASSTSCMSMWTN